LKQGLVLDLGEPKDSFHRALVSSQTEIKFAVESGCKPTLLEGTGDGARQTSNYETIYFDTDNLDLRRHQLELYVRNRDGRVTQKIKTRAENVQAYQCQEILLSDLQPNLAHARVLLPPNVRALISPSALKPRFCTRFSRISREFTNDACVTRISFDEGHIEAMGRSESISEVRLKLKGGKLDSYTSKCLSFLAEVPAALLLESKATRGYRLAACELPRAVSAPPFALPWNLPLPEAILGILRHSFKHCLDNYPAVTLSGEPPSIHQMRVAMRRLRSAIRMFSPVLCLDGAKDLFGTLRGVFTKLGEVREADVFVGETLPLITGAGLGEKLEAVLRTEITTFRGGAYREVCGELTSPNFARMIIQLNNWIEGASWLKSDRPIDVLLLERTAEDFAVPRIRALHSKLLKSGSKARSGTLDDWHRTRIAAKKLRYAGEPLFDALAPKIEPAKLSKQLSRLQTSLGRLNDLQTITPFLARVRPNVQGRNRRNFEDAEQFCRGWSGAAVATRVDQAKDAMKGFEKIRLDVFA
jgi:CHAD domain-containing protein